MNKKHGLTRKLRLERLAKAAQPVEQDTIRLNKKKKRRISDVLVEETILGMCGDAGILSSIRPETIAQELYPEAWQTMLKRVRLMAKQLATAGKLNILRKGKVVAPDEAKGIVRLQIIPSVEGEEEE